MWIEEPDDIHGYFSSIENEEVIPGEQILGETYHVLPQSTWSELIEDWEAQGKDVSRLDTDGAHGSAYREAPEADGMIVVDHERPEEEVRSTAKHLETYIAIGDSADAYNQQGVGYARENFHREQIGLEEFHPGGPPLLSMVFNQWKEPYSDAARNVGDENALGAASETLREFEPSLFQQVKTPYQNPYVEEFKNRV